jgi:hypothetical protein
MEDKLTELIFYTQLGVGGLLLAFTLWAFFALSSGRAAAHTKKIHSKQWVVLCWPRRKTPNSESARPEA